MRRAIQQVRGFQPRKDALASEDEEQGDEGDDKEMEDVVSPVLVKLEALFPDNYDEEAAMTTALELSRANEEAR